MDRNPLIPPSPFILRENAALRLAYQLSDDTIWRLLLLIDGRVKYTSVTSILNSGIAVPGRPVSETVLIYPTVRAWNAMLERSRHPLESDDIREYARLLGLHDPQPGIPSSGDAERLSFDLLRILWSADPRLAAICANHVLIHADIGLFAPPADNPNGIASILTDDRFDEYADACVERLPGGLTDRELSKNRTVYSN
ncbi:hypothetical protein [Bifidobacterium sp. SO1]|uniref:hypothetical protein n=1 Tax=Bifidobacterium sp. SO1 TaxID=2809029 RepID=UPI001BDDA63B|nr:hypothetical protein [Bifidobacterium sp. SO1]MBT1161697.1 hypothetical protein [Bifidobacterium sp. SO1]